MRVFFNVFYGFTTKFLGGEKGAIAHGNESFRFQSQNNNQTVYCKDSVELYYATQKPFKLLRKLLLSFFLSILLSLASEIDCIMLLNI